MPVSSRSAIAIGQSVWLVQKHHQGSGKLTRGTVAAILTNSAQHHRGIKVRTTTGIVGRVEKLDVGGDAVQRDYEEDDDSSYVFVEPRNAPPPQPASAPAPPPPLSRNKSSEDWPELGRVRASASAPWTCPFCTLINQANHSICQACEAPKRS